MATRRAISSVETIKDLPETAIAGRDYIVAGPRSGGACGDGVIRAKIDSDA
jgi:hypothetical protein